MSRRNTLLLIIILAIFAFAVVSLVQPLFGRDELRLGLDLVGGVHLVYQAQFEEGATAQEKTAAMSRALDTIRKRIDKYGVTEPIIQQEGERILVQLPGFTDMEAAKKLVEQTGFLEFREVELSDQGRPVTLDDYLANATDFFNKNERGNRIFVDDRNNPVALLTKKDSTLIFTNEAGDTLTTEQLKQIAEQVKKQTTGSGAALVSWIPARGDDGTELTGGLLDEAMPEVASQTTGGYQVHITWGKEGGAIFDQIARRLYTRPRDSLQRSIGIFLDNVLISYPQILEASYQGEGVITGNFTRAEVENLANLLTSGALPMPLQKPPLFEEKISATLGANFIDNSIKAGIIGIILVMLFMIAYYRIPGLLASLALVFYGAVVMAIFKLIPVTLTLAGIGGFIVSIGMAVDANVLIFERMKEELRTGQTLGSAIEAGFKRAWTAIWDSNMTTFIVCAILYWLGSSVVASAPVMGFALTLFIGVAVSMFTAITVTRAFLRLTVGSGLAHKTSLFRPMGG
ncbi:MAG: protein translocase subunit SecD [Chloroflexi bacterium]|nr:protein translocase subunit SecD [Chloroflexota bacterium]